MMSRPDKSATFDNAKQQTREKEEEEGGEVEEDAVSYSLEKY